MRGCSWQVFEDHGHLEEEGRYSRLKDAADELSFLIQETAHDETNT